MYSDLSDNELLELIGTKKNNEAMETLIKRYGPLVTRQSRSLYIIGADEEDLIQEGMIGLIKAINVISRIEGRRSKLLHLRA